jgi:hypothetical protein
MNPRQSSLLPAKKALESQGLAIQKIFPAREVWQGQKSTGPMIFFDDQPY